VNFVQAGVTIKEVLLRI